MTDNEKIARFAGWTDHPMFHGLQPPEGSPMATPLPSYSTDAEAIQLLNVLVEKGYRYELSGMRTVNTSHWCGIKKPYDSCWIVEEHRSSINESILAAVLAVIERETLCELKSK